MLFFHTTRSSPQYSPMLRTRIARVIGNPLAFAAAVAFLTATWATIERTGTSPIPLFKVRGVPIYPFHRSQPFNNPSQRLGIFAGFEYAPNTHGTYAVTRTHPGCSIIDGNTFDDPTPRYSIGISILRKRSGLLAPTQETSVVHARAVSYHFDRELRFEARPAPNLDTILDALPHVERAMTAPLRSVTGHDRSAQLSRVLWWGHLWNIGVILALVVALGSVFCMPAWFRGGWFSRRHRRDRIVRGLCPRCAYPTRTDAGTLPTCPECGETAHSVT